MRDYSSRVDLGSGTTRYRTIAVGTSARMTERRSVFECRLEPVTTELEARTVIDAVRSEHWDAGHHCSAFILGADARIARSSDDGEPAGTAGMPMLEVLAGAEVVDVVAVVSRWFGGVLLGTGGLVRAYSAAVRGALSAARIRERELYRRGHLLVSAAHAGRLEYELRARGVVIVDVAYGVTAGSVAGADTELTLAASLSTVARVDSTVAELTRGQAQVEWRGQEWVDRPSA